MSRLLKAGVDIDVKDEQGRSALILTAKSGYNRAVRFLVDQGIDLVIPEELKEKSDGREVGCMLAVMSPHPVLAIMAVSVTHKMMDDPRSAEKLGKLGNRMGGVFLIRSVQHEEIAEVVLDIMYGADVNTYDEFARYSDKMHFGYGMSKRGSDAPSTPLEMAEHKGDGAIVQLLLANGASHEAQQEPERVKERLYRQLYFACFEGDRNEVEHLLEQGAEVDQRLVEMLGELCEYSGWSFFSKDRKETLRLVKEVWEQKKAKLNESLVLAAYAGKVNEVTKLLEQGADVDARNNGQTALMFAAINGHPETVRVLLEAGADIDATTKRGETAADLTKGFADLGPEEVSISDERRAVYAGIVTLFEEAKKAKQEAVDQDIIREAAFGSNDQVEKLLKQGADPNARNEQGDTPLIAYAKKNGGNPELINLLLEAGADIDAVDKDGNTALIELVRCGKSQSLQWFLEAGADWDKENNKGQTAHMIARNNHHSDVYELLERAGAADHELHEPKQLNAALLQASQDGKLDRASKLLEKGADVNARNEANDLTPLMLAAGNGHSEVAELLLEKGADVNAHSRSRRVAYEYAYQHGHEELGRMLEEAGRRS